MTWREAVKIVMEKKKWRQEDLAEYLGIDPSTVSKMGTGWELHWQSFLKLLPYFAKYDVIQEHDLHGHKPHELLSNQSSNKKIKIRTGSQP